MGSGDGDWGMMMVGRGNVGDGWGNVEFGWRGVVWSESCGGVQ